MRLAFACVLATQAVPEPERRGAHRIDGTVVAIDAKGVDHAGEGGQLWLLPEGQEPFEVVVRGGAWQAWVDRDVPLAVIAGTLEERSLDFDEMQFPAPLPPSIALRAPWVDELVVRVTDAESGEELTGIDVVAMPRGASATDHPGDFAPEQLVRSGSVSPLRFSRFGRWFVGAPGHAWQAVQFLDGDDLARTLPLPRACELVIEAPGLASHERGQLVIRRPEAGPLDSPLVTLSRRAGDRQVVRGLPTGRVVVEARLDFDGRPWRGHFVPLASKRVVLSLDEAAHVSLALAPVPPGLHADGTIERTGFVSFPDGSRRVRSTADGELHCRPVVRHVDAVDAEPLPGAAGSATWYGLYNLSEGGAPSSAARAVQRVAIRGGAFSLRVPYGSWLRVESLTLDGKPIALGLRERFFATASEPIELAVPGAAATSRTMKCRLSVIDSATKRPLSRVSMALDRTLGGSSPHPGVVAASDLLVAGESSPLHPPLASNDSEARWYWVGAEGYAWSRVDLDPAAPGTVVVELARAARLTVELIGEPPRGAIVRVRSATAVDAAIAEAEREIDRHLVEVETAGSSGESSAAVAQERARVAALVADLRAGAWRQLPPLLRQPLLERAVAAGEELTVEGLPPGEYVASCELGTWYRDPQCFTAVPIVLAAGRDGSVRLDVPPQSIPATVPLRGTLVVPPAWGVDELRLSLDPSRVPFRVGDRAQKCSVAPVVDGEPGLFRFDAGTVLPGRYEFEVDPLGYRRSIEIGPDGATDLRVELPPPATVSVEFVDDATGAPVALEELELAWRWLAPDASCFVEEVVEAPSGRFTFRAIEGPITLFASDDRYADFESSVMVVASRTNEFTLRLKQACGVDLALLDAGRPVALRWGWTDAIKVRDAEGKRVACSVRLLDSGPRMELAQPDRYRIDLPPLPGYQPIAPIEVLVRTGEYVEVAVELVPDR